ncbi:MAG: hypothetical protein DWQ37_18300 [Planctomycetota bacterium]|nr:MAG: hypothetical protein DWQ37_18300 [Planctomycetota bacterium]
MAHPLEQKIGQVRKRARLLLALYAAGWTLSAVALTALVLALLDYVFRFQDRGIRLMCSGAVVAVAVWTLYRFWYQAFWCSRLSDVQVAQRIERRFPSLGDRLASTIQFLKQPEVDPQAGSAALRRAVVIQTESELAQLDVTDAIEPRPTQQAVAVACVVLLVAGLFVAAAPGNARIALARLARPLGDDAWPRYYRVEFLAPPTQVAAGQDFEAELIRDAEHRLPDDVRIHYRYKTPEGYEEESESMKWLNGALVARKESVNRPFWYRAEGGDDNSMKWIRLNVLEAPRLEALSLELHPPEYSGLPVEESQNSIRALRGTKVALSATTNKKLKAARLLQTDAEPIDLVIGEDGYTVSLGTDAGEPFVIDKSGQYWVELADEEGLSGGADERWEIRAIADGEPTVTVEEPSTNIYVTPGGEVAVRIAVKDDLAIRDVALHYKRSDRTDVEDFAVELFQRDKPPPRYDAPGLLVSGKLGESRVEEYRWQLAELRLEPSAQLTFWATAGDYLPQTGKSTPRQITIITPAELEERLAQRQSLVFAELGRVLKMQQDARGQTKALEIQLDEVGRVAKNDVDHAQGAELNQRQVTRTLTSETEGIPAQIADYLAELRSNRVDSPDVERKMTAILDEIERLQSQNLGTIESDLTRFIKAAQTKLADAASESAGAQAGEELKSAMASVGANQDHVVSSLEQLLGDLSRWDNYRRFARDIGQLERDQQEIARRTKELAAETLGRELKQLDEQQQADLKKLGSEQIDLSRRLEKIEQQMSQMSNSLAETDPLAASTLADGLHQARQRAISGQMREASGQVERNQLGQATQQQARVAKDLEEMMSILSNRREQELARLVEKLREAEDELSGIRKQQAGLRKKMRDAEQIADEAERKRQLERLTRQQKQLEDQAARLARRLQRLQAEQASGSMSSAAGKMAGAGQSGEQGDAGSAQQQAGAAEKDLEEAQQQLAERRRQAEQDLAREQLARLEDSLKSLHERQQKLIQETQRLENLRVEAGRLSRAQLGTLGDVARGQQGLESETTQLADKLMLSEVIHLALDGAATRMSEAAELLDDRQTGAKAQGAQEAARQRLAQLMTAFKKDQRPGAGQKQGGGGSGGGGGGGGPDGNLVLAQLKLLKLMQQDLNGRYRDAVAAREDDPRGAGRTISEIAQEQGKLAELVLKLSEPAVENPEDTPEKLPDVREDETSLDDALLESLELDDIPLGEGAAGGESPPEVPAPEPALTPAREEPN